jgi:uncharacterized DUF497 family protein
MDIRAIEFLDRRRSYGEERWVMIGVAGSDLICVVYTERQDRIRIISARRATKNEKDRYFEQSFKTDDPRRH